MILRIYSLVKYTFLLCVLFYVNSCHDESSRLLTLLGTLLEYLVDMPDFFNIIPTSVGSFTLCLLSKLWFKNKIKTPDI